MHYLSTEKGGGEDENSSVSSKSRHEDDPFKTEFVKVERQTSLSLDDLYGEQAARGVRAILHQSGGHTESVLLTDVDKDDLANKSSSKQGKKRLNM